MSADRLLCERSPRRDHQVCRLGRSVGFREEPAGHLPRTFGKLSLPNLPLSVPKLVGVLQAAVRQSRAGVGLPGALYPSRGDLQPALVRLKNEEVTFTWKDYAQVQRLREMTLSGRVSVPNRIGARIGAGLLEKRTPKRADLGKKNTSRRRPFGAVRLVSCAFSPKSEVRSPS